MTDLHPWLPSDTRMTTTEIIAWLRDEQKFAWRNDLERLSARYGAAADEIERLAKIREQCGRIRGHEICHLCLSAEPADCLFPEGAK